MKLAAKFEDSSQFFGVEFNDDNPMDANFGEVQIIRGLDGKSAYEVAVADGFEGTEEEWLDSLKGLPGKPGKDGYTPIKGVDYFDGKDGADGKTPVKGTDYYTEADKAEMVSAVIAQLPVYNGEVVDV